MTNLLPKRWKTRYCPTENIYLLMYSTLPDQNWWMEQNTYTFTLHKVKVLFIGNYRHSKGSNCHWVSACGNMNCINRSTDMQAAFRHVYWGICIRQKLEHQNPWQINPSEAHKAKLSCSSSTVFLRGPKHWCRKVAGPAYVNAEMITTVLLPMQCHVEYGNTKCKPYQLLSWNSSSPFVQNALLQQHLTSVHGNWAPQTRCQGN
jgi:hypothetical protein